jgi:large subunit ribosomal protein L32
MAVPKQRQTRSRTRRRRGGHNKIQAKKLVVCTNCKKEILPHRACPYCGYYKGKKITGVVK